MDSIDLILKYFPDLSDLQIAQFEQLLPLYEEWNAQINVISRKDIDHLYERHVLHSLGIARLIRFSEGAHILDVGTGGGFPGIPLAIMNPEARFHLVDSIAKKIKVVNEVADAIGLDNLFAEQKRAENVDDEFDFVVSRAVTQMPVFMQWVRKKIKKDSLHTLENGVLYLKGGDLTEELKKFKRKRIFSLAHLYEEEFFETKAVVYIPV